MIHKRLRVSAGTAVQPSPDSYVETGPHPAMEKGSDRRTAGGEARPDAADSGGTRGALRRLADGRAYRTTVAAAARAARDAERARAFRTAGGLARLDRALDAAGRTDDRAAVRVGRSARAALVRSTGGRTPR
jgi:hypothetical protein